MFVKGTALSDVVRYTRRRMPQGMSDRFVRLHIQDY